MKVEEGWASCTGAKAYGSTVEHFSWSKSSCLYNIPNTTQLTWLHLFPACHPRKFSWSHHLQPAAHTMHVDTPPSSMPHMELTRRFWREHLRLVYLAFLLIFVQFFARCIDRCQMNVHVNITQVRFDLVVMAVKEYSIFLKNLAL